MAYFGGGGISGPLHPSLRAYIDCFDSAPFPKMWPRGGGIWDQDPVLVRDFRTIRDYELQWKSSQNEDLGAQDAPSTDPIGLENALDEYIRELEDSGEAF